MKKEEDRITQRLTEWIKIQHPDLIYRVDLAGIKLTEGQAVKNKKVQMKERGYPDVFLAEPKGVYCGFYIEIKVSSDCVLTKNGKFRKSEHIQEQLRIIRRLNKKGYLAMFGFGLEDCIDKIRRYMKL